MAFDFNRNKGGATDFDWPGSSSTGTGFDWPGSDITPRSDEPSPGGGFQDIPQKENRSGGSSGSQFGDWNSGQFGGWNEGGASGWGGSGGSRRPRRAAGAPSFRWDILVYLLLAAAAITLLVVFWEPITEFLTQVFAWVILFIIIVIVLRILFRPRRRW